MPVAYDTHLYPGLEELLIRCSRNGDGPRDSIQDAFQHCNPTGE